MKIIDLRKIQKSRSTLISTALALLMCSSHGAYASSYSADNDSAPSTVVQQQKTIRGTVLDSGGEPVIGANVIIKGTTIGTVTNIDGKFDLQAAVGAIIRITYIGYNEQEITVDSRTNYEITLSEDSQSLDEVLVVAYGTAKKSTFTGSASIVKADKLEKISGSGFAESLQGMSAGVSVVNNEGNPGGDSKILIRGIGSMSASSNPLYVVDGMPYDGKLTSISPTDIESMTVLKDAAAASLYGSRAANGVVVINTKKGKSGKPQVNFKSSWGTSDLAVANPKTKADPYQHLTNTWEGMYNDQFYKYGLTDAAARKWASDNVLPKILKATTNSAGQPTYVSPFKHINEYYVLENGQINPNLQMVWDKSDYDIYGAIYSHKLRQEYSADVSGKTADDKTSYYFSLSYLGDKGFALSQYFNRYSFRANVTSQVTPWLDLGGNLAYSSSRQNLSGFQRASIFTTSMYSPWLRNRDNTDWEYNLKTGERMRDYGTYVQNFFGAQVLNSSGDYWDNPNDYSFDNQTANMISSRFFAEVKLPFDLKFKSGLSIDDNTSKNLGYGSAIHGGSQLAPYGVTVMTNGGSASRSNSRTTSVTWNNILSMERTFGEHTLSALAGQEFYNMDYMWDYGYGEGIMQPGQFELASTTKNWSVSSQRDRYALLSWLAKVDYGFKNKYYLSGSYRRDGSSRFAESNRWGDFFSVGASWRLSKESFMETSSSWLDNLSLRASYGTSGNDNIGTYYAYQATYQADNMYGSAGLKPQSMATPWLKWEKNVQFNVAADFTLFSNRLSGTIEYYKRSATDLLYYKTLPISAQVGSATGMNTNLGDIQNSGLEVTLNFNAITTKDFKWSIDANWSSLKNEITSLPGGEFTYSDRVAGYKLAEGHSRYEFFMVSNGGVSPETGNMRYWIKNAAGERVLTEKFSEVKVSDYEWQGSALPKGFGSITNNFIYKDFDLSFMLYYSYGAKMFDYAYIERTTLRGGVGVIQDLVQDRWRKPGDNALLPRWSNDDYANTRQGSNFYLFNNDYLRLRNLTIGYTLPASMLKIIRLNKVRLFVTGDNLLTFGNAANRYTEPETGISGNNYNGSSVTDNGRPSTRRVFMGGVQVSF